MSNPSEEQMNKISGLVEEFGYAGTAEKLGIKQETVRRINRFAKARTKETPSDPIVGNETLVRKILERYSPAELQAIASGGLIRPSRRSTHDFNGEEITIRGKRPDFLKILKFMEDQ